jgi:hypothetical protein
MRTRFGRTFMIGLVLVSLLSGCASVARQEYASLPNAENPEYIVHPFRLIALFTHPFGHMLQFATEPWLLAMNRAPDAFGLSLDEQVYLTGRGEAWSRALNAQQGRP